MIKIIFVLSLLLLSIDGFSKIADAPIQVYDGISYSSHEKSIRARKNGKTLWSTLLPIKDLESYNQNLEQDVRWNIAWLKSVDSRYVYAKETKGNHLFKLDRNTGKILKTTELQN